MPIAPIIQVVLGTGKSTVTYRTLVLVDGKTRMQVYAKFACHFDDDASPDAVAQLFDDSLAILQDPSTILFDEHTLPIVRHIGRWTETIVERTALGEVKIYNGEPKTVDSYMGIGG